MQSGSAWALQPLAEMTADEFNVWMQYFIGSFLLASFAGLGTSLLGYVSLAIFKLKKSQKA